MGEFSSFLLLMFGFLPMSFLITRSWPKAVLLSPVISLSMSALVAQAHVVFDADLSQIYLSLMALQLLAFVSGFAFKNPRSEILFGLKSFPLKESLISFMAIVFSALAYVAAGPPLVWDARSIWLSKASWLNGPASQYLIAQQDKLSGHPDYPLTGPSIMASFWDLQGVSENLQSGVSLMAFFPILILGLGSLYLLESMFGKEINWIHVGFVFLLLGATSFAANDMIGSGYMDVPLSSTVLSFALVSLAYFFRPSKETLATLVFLLLIANNLKQEGQIFSLVTLLVIALALLLATRYLKLVLGYFLPLLVVFLADRIIWSRFSDFAGLPESSSTSSILGNLPELVQPSSRFYELLAQLIDRVGFVNLLFWQVLVIVAVISSRLIWKNLVDTTTVLVLLALPVASAGMYLVTALTYTLGGARDRLDWWLGTSYGRITSTPELLLIGGLFVLALIASSRDFNIPNSISKDPEKELLDAN